MMKTHYQKSDHHLENAKKAREKAYAKRPCVHCSVSMNTGGLALHESICLYDDNNKRNCRECDLRIYDSGKKVFCSKSCSAKFNNRKKERVFDRKIDAVCKGCKKNFAVRKNSLGYYCSNTCQAQYRWETVTKPNISKRDTKHIGKLSFRRYLIEEFGETCVKCGQGPSWQGEPLTLEMDHTDGDTANNQIDNLRLLCPNCHTQTNTWGKKKRIII